MGHYLNWAFGEIAVFMIFIWMILNPFPSRIAASLALIFLSLSPLLLALKEEVLAEQMSIYAFYFLFMTVLMAIYELKKDNQSNKTR